MQIILVGWGGMTVLISHRKIDKLATLTIRLSFKIEDVKYYIDELDEEIKTTDDITELIMRRVEECSHMMVVVSKNTQGSWWVPFEIGVASGADRRITTYNKGDNIALPDFLSKWPILNNDNDLNEFIKLYKKDAIVPIMEGRTFAKAAYSISEANVFHRELKRLIGQR
jgi:hypothetical protein